MDDELVIKVGLDKTEDEFEQIVGLIKEASDELNYIGKEFDEDHVRNYLKATFYNDSFHSVAIRAFIGDEIIGILGAVLCPNVTDPSWVSLTNLFFVKKDYRKKTSAAYYLLKVYLDTLKKMNVSHCSFGVIHENSPESLKRFLNRLGFEKREEIFYREV